MPNIPDIKPDIDVTCPEAVNLLLSSIALQEIGLSHIINAEGEKIQAVLKEKCFDFDKVLKVNQSVRDTLDQVLGIETILRMKLQDVLKLIANKDFCCNPDCKKHESKCKNHEKCEDKCDDKDDCKDRYPKNGYVR